jgi:hypothetical protein
MGLLQKTNQDNGYENLFVAIFEQALSDDLHGMGKGKNNEYVYGKNSEFQKLFDEVKYEVDGRTKDELIHKEILKRKGILETAIKQRVYNESQNWPKREDKRYKRIYEAMKKGIISSLIPD